MISLTPEWKKELKKLFWLLLYPIAYISQNIAQLNPIFIENYYSNGIYPAISGGVSKFFSIFPFSFAEFLLYALIIALITFIVVCIVKKIRKTLPLIKFYKYIMIILLIGGIGANAFYWMWGFNYSRMPISYSMQLNVTEREPQELADLCVALAATANELREDLSEDENQVFTYSDGKESVLERIPDAYTKLGEQYSQFSREIVSPKPVYNSEAMSVAGIAGIFIPFTEEANVNVHEPDLLFASSAAHESAHLMGYAREDEANFIAYLACMASEDKELMYSGVMLALINAGNALSDISMEAYSQLHAQYSDAVKRDLVAYNEYRQAYEGSAEEIVEQINDNYLRANNQQSGVLSYGYMVDLLLAYYE